jgi:hypothetical protein
MDTFNCQPNNFGNKTQKINRFNESLNKSRMLDQQTTSLHMASLSPTSENRYLSLLNSKGHDEYSMLQKLPHLIDELYGGSRNGRPQPNSNS